MMKIRFIALLNVCILVSVVGCGPDRDAVREGPVVDKSVSPDGMVEAVVVAPDLGGAMLGATVSQPYQVYLRSLRPGITATEVILNAQRTDGLRVRWADQKLTICYADAQILHFKNSFDVYENGRKRLDLIEILLKRIERLDEC